MTKGPMSRYSSSTNKRRYINISPVSFILVTLLICCGASHNSAKLYFGLPNAAMTSRNNRKMDDLLDDGSINDTTIYPVTSRRRGYSYCSDNSNNNEQGQRFVQLQRYESVPNAQAAVALVKKQQNIIQQTTEKKDYILSSLVAGVGSGAIASLICAPLDLIRTRLQVLGTTATTASSKSSSTVSIVKEMFTNIYKQDGPKGFFRGLGATLLTVPAFWGVYFPLYEESKRYLAIHAPEKVDAAFIHMGSAIWAGAVADLLCNPMFVVRTRLQTEALHHVIGNTIDGTISSKRKQLGMISTAASLYKEGGVPIFWRGMTANLLGLSHVAVQFPVYERLKQASRNPLEPTPGELLIASGLSKMTASLVSYPHEVIRSRMMDSRVKVTLMQTCRSIYAKEGIWGFYAGLPVSLVRVLPNTCITFVTYELFLRWTRKRLEDKKMQR